MSAPKRSKWRYLWLLALVPWAILMILLIAVIIVLGVLFLGGAAAAPGSALIAVVLYVGLKYLWRQSHPKVSRQRKKATKGR